jgi:hypothetical protein
MGDTNVLSLQIGSFDTASGGPMIGAIATCAGRIAAGCMAGLTDAVGVSLEELKSELVSEL